MFFCYFLAAILILSLKTTKVQLLVFLFVLANKNEGLSGIKLDNDDWSIETDVWILVWFNDELFWLSWVNLDKEASVCGIKGKNSLVWLGTLFAIL